MAESAKKYLAAPRCRRLALPPHSCAMGLYLENVHANSLFLLPTQAKTLETKGLKACLADIRLDFNLECKKC